MAATVRRARSGPRRRCAAQEARECVGLKPGDAFAFVIKGDDVRVIPAAARATTVCLILRMESGRSQGLCRPLAPSMSSRCIPYTDRPVRQRGRPWSYPTGTRMATVVVGGHDSRGRRPGWPGMFIYPTPGVPPVDSVGRAAGQDRDIEASRLTGGSVVPASVAQCRRIRASRLKAGTAKPRSTLRRST